MEEPKLTQKININKPLDTYKAIEKTLRTINVKLHERKINNRIHPRLILRRTIFS